MIESIWIAIKDVGSVFGLASGGLLAAYYALPPFKKAVDTWVERRIGARFDKELEDHRHRLELDAEAVRAQHQRRLQDFSLSTIKRHEVYAELFKLLLIADGSVQRLWGGRLDPDWEKYSAEDISKSMEAAGFTSTQRDDVLQDWDRDRKTALRVYKEAMRNVEKHQALTATTDAKNYFLVNSLFLRDAVSSQVADILRVLNELLSHALIWLDGHSGKEITRLGAESSEGLEVLKRTLRADLEAGGMNKLPAPDA